jgi:hypothetical protein
MTPAFTTKCLVRTCSPNKHGWQWLSIRDHETDRGRRSLARQGLRPRGRKSVAGDGRFVERLASFTAVGWQFGIQAGGRPVSRAMATSQCGQFRPFASAAYIVDNAPCTPWTPCTPRTACSPVHDVQTAPIFPEKNTTWAESLDNPISGVCFH